MEHNAPFSFPKWQKQMQKKVIFNAAASSGSALQATQTSHPDIFHQWVGIPSKLSRVSNEKVDPWQQPVHLLIPILDGWWCFSSKVFHWSTLILGFPCHAAAASGQTTTRKYIRKTSLCLNFSVLMLTLDAISHSVSLIFLSCNLQGLQKLKWASLGFVLSIKKFLFF